MSDTEAGLNIIRRIYQTCRVDAEWSVWDERGYTWWGGRLSQRLWVDDSIEDEEFSLYPMHARTDILRGVKPSDENYATLARVNRDATYSALCLDPDSGTVFSHTRYNCHAENHDLAEMMFQPAAVLQVAHAHTILDDLHNLMGGTPCITGHPVSGLRKELDDMLNVATVFQAAGQADAADLYDEFARLQEIGKQVSVETNFGPDDLTAEFPFHEKLKHPFAQDMAMTALYRLKTGHPHTDMGSGLLARLDLPCLKSRPEVANAMNLQMTRGSEIENALGAWTCDERTLHHQLFIPNLSLRPGMAVNCFMYGFKRCLWASQFCEENDLVEEVLNAPPSQTGPDDAFAEFMLEVAVEAGPGASREELRALILNRLQELPDGYFDDTGLT